MLTRKDSMRIHFKRRFYERFGLATSDEEINKTIQKIKKKKLNLLYKGENGRSGYSAVMGQELVTIVYDESFNELVTVFPPNRFVKWKFFKKYSL